MQTNEANIFLFIASIIIGLLIAMNMDLGKGAILLDVEQYEVAYTERNKLQNEISDLQEEYLNLTDKVSGFDENSKDENDILLEITEELKRNRILLGVVPVKGEGIKITLNDAPEVMFGGDYTSSMLVHDKDLVRVINDLRNAGAEAIAVNDHRIVYNSAGLCWGATIDFDGIRVIAPFYITAIGNKNVLQNFLETQDNQVKKLKMRKCYVEMETFSELTIPAYNGSIESKYLFPGIDK
jgi:uncharacterized protein YlxW (UPF0749 family)